MNAMPSSSIQDNPTQKSERSVRVIRGQHHKFMLLPVTPENAKWFDAGPVAFAVEARVIGVGDAVVERGASLHVFGADRAQEYLRFDCFEGHPHYHYIHNDLQHNSVWGYDDIANGSMREWAVRTVRTNLPQMLRRAGEDELAARVETFGFDSSVLESVSKELQAAHERTFPGTDLLDEARELYVRWKSLHPEFNTVEEDEY